MSCIAPERWAPTLTFPWIEASTEGRVRNTRTGRVLSTPANSCGYPSLNVRVDGGRQFATLHRLVLEASVGPRPPGMECCHNNGDRADARLVNLRWDTHSANMLDRRKHGTERPLRGESNGRARVTAQQVHAIRQRWDAGVTQLALARDFGISRAQVQNIVHRRQWRHV